MGLLCVVVIVYLYRALIVFSLLIFILIMYILWVKYLYTFPRGGTGVVSLLWF
jgi:hypothetical protein